MKKVWAMVWLIWLPLSLLAQPASNVQQTLKQLDKKTHNLTLKDLDAAKIYALQGLALAQKANDKNYTATFYSNLGAISVGKHDFQQGITYYNKQLAIVTSQHDTATMVRAIVDIGLAMEYESNYVDAIKYFFDALAFSESTVSHPMIDLIYVDIAAVYSNEKNPQKAIEYANKVFHLKSKSTKGLAKAYEVMGIIDAAAGKYPVGRQWFLKALKLYQNAKDSLGQATMYSDIAGCYGSSYIEDQQSLQYCFKAKAIWDIIQPLNYYSVMNMANIPANYWDMANAADTAKGVSNRKAVKAELAAKADSAFKTALKYSQKTSSKSTTLFILDSLASIQAFEGKYKEAFKNMRQHEQLNDTIYSQKDKNTIASIESARVIALRDKQIEINKLQIANERKQRLFLVAVAVLLVLIVALVYIQSVNRKKNNARLESLNRQLDEANKIKTRFFSILNHDLRRPMASFINLLNIQQNEPAAISEKDREQQSKKIASSAENLLDKMEDLLLWSKGQMENFSPNIKLILVDDVFAFIRNSFEDSGMNITLNAPPGMQIKTDEHFVKTIAENLTNNAVKALSHTPEPAIKWRAWTNKNIAFLSIFDNGPGATKGQLKALYDDSITVGIKNGLGLHIVRDMAKAIGCKVTVLTTENKQGTEIQLEFPGT